MPISLSVAIRAGATLNPQGFGFYFRHVGFTLHACALGGAYQAATGRQDATQEQLFLLWPELAADGAKLHGDIVVWNDMEHRSAVEIAGLVEGRAE